MPSREKIISIRCFTERQRSLCDQFTESSPLKGEGVHESLPVDHQRDSLKTHHSNNFSLLERRVSASEVGVLGLYGLAQRKPWGL